MINKLKVASPPHLRRRTQTSTVMIDVVISLLPAVFIGIHYFGFNVAKLVIASLVSAGISQATAEYFFKKKSELGDYSFAVTAILLALVLPHTTPIWVAVIGNVFAIVFGKVIFGGLGKNIFNPALLGRVFLMISFPQYILHYRTYDGQSGATILPMMKYLGLEKIYNIFGGPVDFYQALITGNNIYGSMGETSITAILLGLIYLKLRGHVKLYLPLSIILTVFLTSYILGYNPFIYILAGGLIFASVYMATDMVTSPYTRNGGIIYGIFIGIMVVFIRKTTSYPEGVSYAILMANIFVPFINKYTKPRVFGKEFNMKEIKIALICIISIAAGVFGIIKLDSYVSLKRANKIKEYRTIKILSLVSEGKKIGEDSDTFMQEGYLFRPIFSEDDNIEAYVVEGEAKGYSHHYVDFILTIDTEGNSTGFKVLRQEETKGLGSRIEEEEWQNVFIGLNKDSEFDKDIDSFSGATYTFANMFKEIINILSAFSDFNEENHEDIDSEAGASDGEWSLIQKRDDLVWV